MAKNRQAPSIKNRLKDLSLEVKRLRKEGAARNKAIRKEVAQMLAAQRKKEKLWLKSVKKDFERIRKNTDKALRNFDKRISSIEAAWDPAVLKQLVESFGAFSKSLKAMEKRSRATLKNLEKTNLGVLAMAKHARDIEEEHVDIKFAAKELAEKSKNLNATVQDFFKQTDALNTKLNSNMSVLNELTSTAELLKDRINLLEQKAAAAEQLQSLISENSKALEQLAKRLAYLEKVSVKTIVLE